MLTANGILPWLVEIRVRTGARVGVFYGIFAVFLALVILFILLAAGEYAVEAPAGRQNGGFLLVGAVLLLALAVWWLLDVVRQTPPNTAVQVARAIVFLLVAGPVLSSPVFATARGAARALGRVRRLLWRPASIIGLVMTVLWFLS